MTDWVRLWHDMPTDPKWRVIARKSGQPLPCVIAVFNLMMVSASQNADNRGTLLGWDDEDAGAALDMDGEDVAAIREAMQGKVLDGDRLSGWERRQPKRERENDNSSQRVKEHRQRKSEALPEEERHETPCNAAKRLEESRGDKNIPLSNDNGTPPSDKEFWESAKAYVGKSKAAKVGQWVRDYGKEPTAQAITAAQLERAVEPIAYIERTLRNGKARASPEFSSPC